MVLHQTPSFVIKQWSHIPEFVKQWSNVPEFVAFESACGQNKTVHHLFTQLPPKQLSSAESLAGAQKNEKQSTIQTICETFSHPLSFSSEPDCSNFSVRFAAKNHTHRCTHPRLFVPSLPIPTNTNLASTRNLSQMNQNSPHTQKIKLQKR